MDTQNQFDAQQQPSPTASRELNQGESKELKKDTNTSTYLSNRIEQRTQLLLNLLGYGLMAFALVDYIHTIIPLRITDPGWEFQTIGALVEHSAVPLLGLILVFYRHEGHIGKWEKKFLGFFSWISLLLGLLYLLMLPLGVADTWRIYHRSNAQIAAQLSQQSQQFQQIKGQLNQAKTDEQIEQLVSVTTQGRPPQIKNPQEFKKQYLAQVDQAQWKMQSQAKTVQKNQTQALLKNSVKWNLGALISATLFLSIWHITRWARKSK